MNQSLKTIALLILLLFATSANKMEAAGGIGQYTWLAVGKVVSPWFGTSENKNAAPQQPISGDKGARNHGGTDLDAVSSQSISGDKDDGKYVVGLIRSPKVFSIRIITAILLIKFLISQTSKMKIMLIKTIR